MGSILIIQRHPILREALRQFLFPEHRTVTWDRWSGQGSLQGVDLAIVDRETLVEGGGTTAEVLRALQRLKIPSVWLHQGPAPLLKPGKLIATVAKPLEGPVLEAAVRSLLGAASVPEARSGAEPPLLEPLADEPRTKGTRGAAGGIIELTEVVDEPGSGEPEINSEN